MATKVSSIIVTGLSSTSPFVDNFTVQCYSNSALTVLVTAADCNASWNGTATVQNNSIVLQGLNQGTTYYLRAASVCKVSGAATWSATWTQSTTTISPPNAVTYGGAYNITTSGISFQVVPSNVTSDIDHFEGLWNFDVTSPPTPAASAKAASGTLRLDSNGQFSFFAGGKPGQLVNVWVRAVNTSHQYQAWTLLGAFTISTTWNGTSYGTIADGSIIGTGGIGVYGQSTGKLGIGYSPTGGYNTTSYGANLNIAVSGAQQALQSTQTGGQIYQLVQPSTNDFRQANNTTGTYSLITSSNGYNGFQGVANTPFQLFNTSNAYVTGNANAAWTLNATGAGSSGQLFSMGNNNGVYVLANSSTGVQNFQLGSGNTFGLNSAPGTNALNIAIAGGTYHPQVLNSGDAGLVMNNGASGGASYLRYTTGSNNNILNVGTGVTATYLTSGGNYGVQTNPNVPLAVTGAVTLSAASNGGFLAQQTTAGYRNYQYLATSNYAGIYNAGASNWSALHDPSNQLGLGTIPAGFLTTPGIVVIDSNSRIASTGRTPPVNAASTPSVLVLTSSAGNTNIGFNASTFYYGHANVGYNSGASNPGSYGTYYGYSDDGYYGGGAVSYVITGDFAATTNGEGRIYFGVITSSSGASGVAKGGGNQRNCTVRGTPVTMADESTRPVETLVPGDLLKTLYGSAEIEWIRETEEQDIYRIELSNGYVVECSGSHSLMVWGLWTEVQYIDLEYHKSHDGRNTRVHIDHEDEVCEITSIEIVRKETVWKLHLKQHHSYIAGGIWSHNAVKA